MAANILAFTSEAVLSRLKYVGGKKCCMSIEVQEPKYLSRGRSMNLIPHEKSMGYPAT